MVANSVAINIVYSLNIEAEINERNISFEQSNERLLRIDIT